MLRTHLPEFLAAIAMSVLLLLGYALRDTAYQRPPKLERATATSSKFLLELHWPQGHLSIDPQGRVQGTHPGQLNPSELSDLRQLLQKRGVSGGIPPENIERGVSGGTPPENKGDWVLTCGSQPPLRFQPQQAPQPVGRILEQLRILGLLHKGSGPAPGKGTP